MHPCTVHAGVRGACWRVRYMRACRVHMRAYARACTAVSGWTGCMGCSGTFRSTARVGRSGLIILSGCTYLALERSTSVEQSVHICPTIVAKKKWIDLRVLYPSGSSGRSGSAALSAADMTRMLMQRAHMEVMRCRVRTHGHAKGHKAKDER